MFVYCPHCLKRYKVPEGQARLLRVLCRGCSREFLVNLSREALHDLAGNGRHATAVVADIQRDFRNSLIDLLNRQGFALTVAEDGSSAYDAVAERCPDLLLVNPYLPGLMGVELIARLRAEGKAPRAIFLLGAIHNSRRYHRRPESLYGADDYLEEGYSDEAVLRKISFHLRMPLEEGPTARAGADDEAFRLARSVFADLLVYHPDRMKKVKDLPGFFAVFGQEAQEAKRYLEVRRPGASKVLEAVVSQYLEWHGRRGGSP